MSFIDGKKIFVTGGTGSFGNAFVRKVLSECNATSVIIYSRDEMKQWEMAQRFQKNPRIKFVIGDVRDFSRLSRTMSGADIVVHAAATKIVPTAEYNPAECIKTNVNGAMNVIDAAYDTKVSHVVALSTDKASNPINLYGATKLASDKLFVASNNEENHSAPKFAVVRYGNVMGSRGSVIPFFIECKKTGRIPITDNRMTRFMITLGEGVQLVCQAFDEMKGGEIFVKKIPSMNILDIARAVAPNAGLDFIGIRPGEKLHEQMIGVEDAPFTYEYNGYFKILPAIYEWASDPKRINSGKLVDAEFSYTSDNNHQWMSVSSLENWISQHYKTSVD